MIDRRYVLVARAAGGGASFRALDRTTGTSVRIETYPRASSDRGSSGRLAKALAEAATVEHSGMVRALDHGAVAGRCYVVTEAPLGKPLGSTAAGDDAWAVAVLRDVAEVLAAAHHHGIVHGDLRPSDVHVTADGVVQLTGFGRAAVAGIEPTPSGDVSALAGVIRATARQAEPGPRLAPMLESLESGGGSVTASEVAARLGDPPGRASRPPPVAARRGLIASLPFWGRGALVILVLGGGLGMVRASGALHADGAAAAVVPEVTGIDQEAAASQLADLGLEVRFERQTDAPAPVGQVLAQEPAGGADTRTGATVTLVVSSGGTLTEVPELTGLDPEDASARLRAAGLSVRMTAGVAGTHVVVTGQIPAPGGPIRQGEAVTILLGPAR